jgi:hypothetical protein
VKGSAIYTPNAYEVICRVARMAEQLRLGFTVYSYVPLTASNVNKLTANAETRPLSNNKC